MSTKVVTKTTKTLIYSPGLPFFKTNLNSPTGNLPQKSAFPIPAFRLFDREKDD
jgi:hypothetical protein